MKLTTEQKDSVISIDGNVCVIASAGSGKTSSFVTRIAYMVQESNIEPYEIMAVTFTKKAAEEMKKRLTKMIGKDKSNKIVMGTFHSISYRLLKALDSEFDKLKIAPDWWRFSLFSDMCRAKDPKNPNGLNLGIKAGELGAFISYQKANMIKYTEPVLIDDNVDYVDCVSRTSLQEAYVKYEELKRASRQIDFDDMLLYMYEKLKVDSAFRGRLANQFKYIMIDEFQDSPRIVMEIVKMINDKNVFVVGDFRQSIYSFINARIENILNFQEEFEDVKLIELNKNFRSTQNIVKLSNQIIANSPIKKFNNYLPSESVAEVGEPIDFTLYNDERSQISSISRKVEELHEQGTPLKEIAILVRTNAETAIIEEVFADKDIPYEVTKSMSFFDRKEILDILSYARLAINREDDASFRRIYNTPNRYLSKTFIHELEKFASDKDMTLLDAVRITPHNAEWKYKHNIDAILKIMNDLTNQAESNVNAGRFIRNIVNLTQYTRHINDSISTPSAIAEKHASIEKLCEMGAKFPSIRAFLAHVGKIKDKQAKAKGTDAVQVITMHSSKGLEWDVCFVVNVNAQIMPHEMNNNLEEERRLFYVACSRPRKRLFVSWFFYDAEANIQKEGVFVEELLSKEETDEMKKELFRGNQESTRFYPTII